MRSIYFAPFAVAFLAACEPTIPDSAVGVGFGDYRTYTREQALAAGATAQELDAAPYAAPLPKQTVTVTRAAPVQTVVAAGPAPTPPAQPQTLRTATRVANPQPAALAAETRQVLATRPATLSRENDFAAVSATRSIQADAKRLEQQRQDFTQVQPTLLPDRPADAGPNIVQYALMSSHPRGVKRFPRSPFQFGNVQKNCAAFATANEAQEAFLAAGGPQRDRKGLDPDGDGYACGWDPVPFRMAVAR